MTSNGTTPTRQSILARLNALEKRIGMHAWTFHQLRHLFCTGLLCSGANVEIVRGLAGHSSLAITHATSTRWAPTPRPLWSVSKSASGKGAVTTSPSNHKTRNNMGRNRRICRGERI